MEYMDVSNALVIPWRQIFRMLMVAMKIWRLKKTSPVMLKSEKWIRVSSPWAGII